MKRFLCLFSAVLLYANCAWAGATFSRVKTWSSGQVLTAADLNAEFDNILNYLTPAGIDDYSATTTAMRSTADPYSGSTESLATSLQGELERIRYQILEIKKAMQASNVTYWYQDLPTAGVFTVAGSSVGVNDTTPSYSLDVNGTARITGVTYLDGNVQSDGNITTSGDDVDFSTHVSIAANLTVTGALSVGSISSLGLSAVSAYVTTSSQTLAGTGLLEIIFGTEVYDTNNEFNTTTGRFTAANDGYYLVQTNVRFYVSPTDTSGSLLAILVNGSSSILYGAVEDTGTSDFISTSALVKLTAGEYISVFVDDKDSSSFGVVGGSGRATAVTIVRILN